LLGQLPASLSRPRTGFARLVRPALNIRPNPYSDEPYHGQLKRLKSPLQAAVFMRTADASALYIEVIRSPLTIITLRTAA
jgi:hypothetical protein